MKPFTTFAEVRRWAWAITPQGPFGFLTLSGKTAWEDLTNPYTGMREIKKDLED